MTNDNTMWKQISKEKHHSHQEQLHASSMARKVEMLAQQKLTVHSIPGLINGYLLKIWKYPWNKGDEFLIVLIHRKLLSRH